MRGLYLTFQHSSEGRSAVKGRLLIKHLQDESDLLVRHCVRAGEPIDDDVLTPEDLLAGGFDFVYVEGGLSDPRYGETAWRIAPQALRSYLSAGGVVLVADVDVNEAQTYWRTYTDASRLFEALPDYRTEAEQGFRQRMVQYGVDTTNNVNADHEVICLADEMLVSPWLRPTTSGIEALVAMGPCVLSTTLASVLATGNKNSSGTRVLDITLYEPWPFAFATVHQVGEGYAAIVAAAVSHDVIVERSPDNARWISNVLRFLSDESQRERSLRRSGTPAAPVPLDEPLPDAVLTEYHAEVTRRFSPIERNLRRLIAAALTEEEERRSESGWAAGRVLAVVSSSDGGRRKKIESASSVEKKLDELYWLEETGIVQRNWRLFEQRFHDKQDFQSNSRVVNGRPAAHSKPVTLRDRVSLDLALQWFEDRLEP